MELTGERLIPADRATTWAAINDPAILKDCIAGCESLERTGDDGFAAVVAVRVGPVSAKFRGTLRLLDVRPPEHCTLQFDAQGGAAGFGKGSADVDLSEAGPGRTTLRYASRATVGGKMAQIGSRLVDAAAAKLAEDFFTAFEARLAPPAAAAPPAGAAGSLSADATSTPSPAAASPARNGLLAVVVLAAALLAIAAWLATR
ncbi:MAG: carbon monoxide dehydrogenase subunit G [Burkholderiales bacterium]|nr:carbon monoxide dehydrogenase subunit G [Burkholderiales bacterium]